MPQEPIALEHTEYIPVEPLAVQHVEYIAQEPVPVEHLEYFNQEPYEIKTVEMVQPEPYEVIHTVEEPIVTHHVAYTEALPASESIAYAATGVGERIVSTAQEVLPLEAQFAGLPRVPVANELMYGGYGAGYVEPVVYGGAPAVVDYSNFYDTNPYNDYAVVRNAW